MHLNRTNPLPILIIDDSLPYVESLHRDAQRFGVKLLHAGSLQEGKELYGSRQARGLAGIILDGKCLKERGQEVPDSSFLSAAVKYFGDKAPHLPLVVLTGEADLYRNLSDLYAGTLLVFSKGRDEKSMLQHLLGEAQKLDWLKVMTRYRDVFDGLAEALGSEVEKELVSCLISRESEDPTSIKNTLSSLRRIQESIYIVLHKADSSLVPGNLVASEVNVVAAYKHLSEKGVIERYKVIDRFSELVYKVSSDNGAHTPFDNPKYPPTRYTVQAVTFALLDLLLWVKGVLKESESRGV